MCFELAKEIKQILLWLTVLYPKIDVNTFRECLIPTFLCLVCKGWKVVSKWRNTTLSRWKTFSFWKGGETHFPPSSLHLLLLPSTPFYFHFPFLYNFSCNETNEGKVVWNCVFRQTKRSLTLENTEKDTKNLYALIIVKHTPQKRKQIQHQKLSHLPITIQSFQLKRPVYILGTKRIYRIFVRKKLIVKL